MVGGMVEAVCSSFQLLPWLMLELLVLLVSIFLPPRPVETAELLLLAKIRMMGPNPSKH
jgi:hypothetical protein